VEGDVLKAVAADCAAAVDLDTGKMPAAATQTKTAAAIAVAAKLRIAPQRLIIFASARLNAITRHNTKQ
jgi:hypothetical protein